MDASLVKSSIDALAGAALNLNTKISLCICGVVFVILTVGHGLIWDTLGTWDQRRNHLLVGVWTMGGVAVAVYFVVRSLTMPLKNLTHLAARLGAGHLEQRAHNDDGDEIGQLARALDGMSSSLLAARQNLEFEVESRTEELRSSQAQLLQAARLAAVGELAAGVAHEINNPAGIILMRAGQLAETLSATDPEVIEDLNAIERQIDKIQKIVAALLTFSRRTEPGGEMVTLDLNAVVLRTAQLMDGLFRSRNVDVELALTQDSLQVRAEGARIEQVLLNLVNNAIDAMPDGGRLTFGTRLMEDKAVVFVADSGSGIPKEHLDRVFDPFFTTKDPGQGTGLGLSISFAIVEQHGGVIEADSKPGEGSRFTLLLPVAPQDDPLVEMQDV